MQLVFRALQQILILILLKIATQNCIVILFIKLTYMHTYIHDIHVSFDLKEQRYIIFSFKGRMIPQAPPSGSWHWHLRR